MLLYSLNTNGVPSNPAYLPGATSAANSANSTILQAQIDALRKQGNDSLNLVNAAMQQQRRMIDSMETRQSQLISAVGAIATSVSLSSRLQAMDGERMRVQDRLDRIDDLLDATPDPAVHARLTARKSDLVEVLARANRNVSDAQRQLDAAQIQVVSALPDPHRPRALDGLPHDTPDASSQIVEEAEVIRDLSGDQKVQSISTLITTRQPHVFTVQETKSTQPVAPRLKLRGYRLYESPGVKLTSGKGGKWGVIVGVRRDLQAQRLDTPSALAGRAVALDLVIPSNDGTGFPHRFIGLYAPWNPGGDDASSSFWNDIANLTDASPFSWSAGGDFNASLRAAEISTGSDSDNQAQRLYRAFLTRTRAFDLWIAQGDVDLDDSYTCRSTSGRSIIDRFAHSRLGIISGSITTLSTFIPATDHRPVAASLALLPPIRHGRQRSANLDAPKPTPRYPPRFRYPRRIEKDRFEDFASRVDASLSDSGIGDIPITDDDSFDTVYTKLTTILRNAGEASFELPSPSGQTPPARRVDNASIRAVVVETKRIGRLLFAARNGGGRLRALVWRHAWAAAYVSAHYSADSNHSFDPVLLDEPNSGLVTFLADTRRSLSKLRYKLEYHELQRRASQSSRARINATLMGGSAKRLYVHAYEDSGPPVALTSPGCPGEFVTTPDGIKNATRSYFTTLFTRQDRPQSQKPWMTTPSVQAIRDRTKREPFVWPQPLTLSSLRTLLRRGNPKPAPGPDGWEKWCIKALHDNALHTVLSLLNYIISSSHFPPSVKPSTLSTIHKRGDRTDLANYRGICCSNFLVNTPFAWMNSLLSPYLSRMGILPQGQIATQPGVQARDLTAFLSMLETWSARTRTPLYVLRRDQQKGFDRLEPQGFYDAVAAYGLPNSLVDFDRSAQTDVPYQIKTAFGLTDPFLISGVAKQGGPSSPIKSTLTTSLGSHWLTDFLADVDHGLRVSTVQNRVSMPHLPIDRESILISMVEAMDDSAIVTPSLQSLCTATHMMERFQAAYGWATNWPKSLAFVLNSPNPPSTIQVPSVDVSNPDSDTVNWHSVDVVTTHLEFLRIRVNDPVAQFNRVRDIITSFQFPILHTRLPLTALRRIYIQCLISRIRPLLSFQPLSPSQSASLDALLASTVHEYFSFPFRFNTNLLTLPVHLHGFDFPSINRLNAGLAVAGLMRDLNHHLPTFRTMARITLADWTCQVNHCCYPLDGASMTRDFGRQTRNLPRSWITAHHTLSGLQLSIRDTDQSYLFEGDVALRHLIRALPAHAPAPRPQPPSSSAISNLERAGFRTIGDIASWHGSLSPDAHLTPHPHVYPLIRFTAAGHQWDSVRTWLKSLTMQAIVNELDASLTITQAPLKRTQSISNAHQPARQIASIKRARTLPDVSRHAPDNMQWRTTREAGPVARDAEQGSLGDATVARVMSTSHDKWTLIIPRNLRQQLAETYLLSIASTQPRPPYAPVLPVTASDASMLPPSPSTFDNRSVTVAVITPPPLSHSLSPPSASLPLYHTARFMASSLPPSYHLNSLNQQRLTPSSPTT
ncbi:hypothetical protein EVJ58_g10282 [Rhodofomes roseus]|uniref:Endonuclease/exonuclease/phosphatase domain-containing protein n=1 Tax=Rhodofomes roseus TaxID=34475 RepID=A0A4Y9XPC3_9APHY|nr:hypothetical protein EVJ58_g10282 [Rhodofomes roseus]